MPTTGAGKALRAKMLELLAWGELSTARLAELTGASVPTVSQQLRQLLWEKTRAAPQALSAWAPLLGLDTYAAGGDRWQNN